VKSIKKALILSLLFPQVETTKNTFTTDLCFAAAACIFAETLGVASKLK
jgi:hypothetical protein